MLIKKDVLIIEIRDGYSQNNETYVNPDVHCNFIIRF
jgi:hypothetical protein